MFWKQNAAALYNVARKWLTFSSLALCPGLMSSDGINKLRKQNTLPVNAAVSSLITNSSAPILFTYTFMTSPLSTLFQLHAILNSTQIALAAMFLAHYVSHLFIDLSLTLASKGSHHDLLLTTLPRTLLNGVYGALMGCFLTSPFARIFLNTTYTLQRPSSYIGLALWIIGFGGSMKHAEIMLTARQNAQQREEKDNSTVDQLEGSTATPTPNQTQEPILRGGLYNYVSHPRYFFEWIQWLGFALIAAPRPPLHLKWMLSLQGLRHIASMVQDPAYLFAQNLAPPFIILLAEVLLTLPRAYHGHVALKEKFGQSYPQNRKAVIPFVF